MEIRPAKQQDVPRLLELAEQFFRESGVPGDFAGDRARSYIERAISNSNFFLPVLVPSGGGDVVGAAVLEVAWHWMTQPWAFIHIAFLEERARGRGAGRILLAALVGWAKSCECGAIYAGAHAEISPRETRMFVNQLRRAQFEDCGPTLVRRL